MGGREAPETGNATRRTLPVACLVLATVVGTTPLPVAARQAETADTEARRGWSFCREGRFADAVPVFREALRADPTFASAHLGLGVAYAGLGRIDDAIRAFEDALRARPGYAEAYYNLGVAYDKAGSLDEAVEAFRRAAAQKEGYAAAL